MKMRRGFSVPAAAALVAAAFVAASATGAPHSHGKGRLALAPGPNGVQFELIVAGADVWGFEHEPRNAEEKERRDAALEALEGSLSEILQFPSGLGCVHQSSAVSLKILERESGGAEEHVEEKHGHEEHDHGHGHEHEEEHGQGHEDEHDGHASGGHLEVRATAHWVCRRSPLGHDVEVRRPSAAPGLSVLEVWVLGPSGQSSTLLRGPSAAVRMQ